MNHNDFSHLNIIQKYWPMPTIPPGTVEDQPLRIIGTTVTLTLISTFKFNQLEMKQLGQ